MEDNITIKEPVDRKKKLNILAIADDSAYGRAAVCHGAMLAAVFSGSLTIVSKFGFTYEDKSPGTESESWILYAQKVVDHDIETIVLPHYFFPETLYQYADETNTIMYVIGVDKSKSEGFFSLNKALRFIKGSRLPVMTVGKELPDKEIYKHVLLPLDIERQAKEKALWAGYFSRFYESTIHILHNDYKDKGLRRQVNDNIAFVEKLYQNLEVKCELNSVSVNQDIDRYSIEYAPTVGASLTVIMMTRYVTLGDLLTGKREKKIIGNPQSLPVLCINQRDDLYVLCT
ncbi:MAG: hypothetical protein K6A41_06350 [Bacteroidales bacterium]|nr:hypothetical protein [Bacteroidales bacterium]